jgi:hypothetical protein
MKRVVFAMLAYVVPSFALGFVWHLVLFKQYYAALAMYRTDVILPFGLLAMLVQAFTSRFKRRVRLSFVLLRQ